MLDFGHRRPRSGRQLPTERVRREHPRQAAEAEHRLARQRHAAADQPGIAPLGNERHTVFPAQRHDAGHLVSVAGTYDGRGRPDEAAGLESRTRRRPVQALADQHAWY